ncbi:hypothetical protein Tdes44962_MAKER08081 [Teratosphaeria destructans]|uniref:Uncharacterized protein n=1 Tax=Teratosphaeria destructans TaxID=418781 RepID=A0A9W7W5E4_9PEZI|nr:hypothetical protein Tdes44962_MAKER08081 [Teratosphaeria destructans]
MALDRPRVTHLLLQNNVDELPLLPSSGVPHEWAPMPPVLFDVAPVPSLALYTPLPPDDRGDEGSDHSLSLSKFGPLLDDLDMQSAPVRRRTKQSFAWDCEEGESLPEQRELDQRRVDRVSEWVADVAEAVMRPEEQSRAQAPVAGGEGEEEDEEAVCRFTFNAVKPLLLRLLFIVWLLCPPTPLHPAIPRPATSHINNTLSAPTSPEHEGLTAFHFPPSFLPTGAAIAMAQWSAVLTSDSLAIPDTTQSTRTKLLVANGMVTHAKRAERASLERLGDSADHGNMTLLQAEEFWRSRMMRAEFLRCLTSLYSSASSPVAISSPGAESWESEQQVQFCPQLEGGSTPELEYGAVAMSVPAALLDVVYFLLLSAAAPFLWGIRAMAWLLRPGAGDRGTPRTRLPDSLLDVAVSFLAKESL